MPETLENRLDDLIHKIKEIRKELILQKIGTADVVKNKIEMWKTLGRKVSSKWDNISAVEEISQQREKTW